MSERWLFADQLGPHFVDDTPIVMVENRGVFRRRRYHRQKAHLILSALRHRAAESNGRLIAAESYREARTHMAAEVEVINPQSFQARALVRSLSAITVLPERGFLTDRAVFEEWAKGRKRLVLEDWYRFVRTQFGWLMDGVEPVGGRWNFDTENREPPPKGVDRLNVPAHWTPQEDEIDQGVRADLDAWEAEGRMSFIGVDGPRWFPVTRAEALQALDDFITHRLPLFGPYEDAMMRQDPVLAHSMLSVPMNLGLLTPREVLQSALTSFDRGAVPLASMEGFLRQIAGWREFIWHTYWHFGPNYVTDSNYLNAREPLPEWFAELNPTDLRATCLHTALAEVRDRGWSHHIIRLMLLGNWGLQRGFDPRAFHDWFIRAFLDAYPWVMATNVIGMALFADGGRMSTKPYAAGGSYIKRMSNYCGDCIYQPNIRVGETACPFTAGYWWFLDRIDDQIATNHRMSQPRAGLRRLKDRKQLVDQERKRGGDAP